MLSRSRSAALAFTVIFLVLPSDAQKYTLQRSSQGGNFFDDWNFHVGNDPNNTANVNYVDKNTAVQQGLVFVNGANRAVVKVDNKTDGHADPNYGRNAVKILSNWTFSTGNLVLFDAVHMPFGCSIWPALWTQGAGNWPDSGEIDIIEGANLQQNNQISLHTLQGCQHPQPPAQGVTPLETGQVVSTDCFNQTNGNEGCIVKVPSTNSYGAGFIQNGGGVYALQWQPDGLRFWFFERSSIPQDLSGDSPNPSGWGSPTAFYPSSSCDLSTFFVPQSLVIQTRVCGGFAMNTFSETCGSGQCTDLVQTPQNYDNAFWEMSYVKLFATSNGSHITPGVSSLFLAFSIFSFFIL